ncbi:MAG: antitoxin family protein [Nitrospirae bacterium]|nr:antitoxin family protein [Nitrospirota bacterium]MDA8214165.1 antitoxin family protein [Nitrospiraceae bacterium]MDA8338336.1 antitoxin family protein [Nitrospiraceae bacterium]
MSQTITAIFEDGVFKPLEKVDVPEHKRLKITLANEVDRAVMEECSLIGIIDIAKDCYDIDLSVHHDKYLYGEVPN